MFIKSYFLNVFLQKCGVQRTNKPDQTGFSRLRREYSAKPSRNLSAWYGYQVCWRNSDLFC